MSKIKTHAFKSQRLKLSCSKTKSSGTWRHIGTEELVDKNSSHDIKIPYCDKIILMFKIPKIII